MEKNYRVRGGRAGRAIAGLSMGGAQALDTAFFQPEEYGYVGVFSSGVFGIAGGPGGAAPNTQWEERHKAALEDPAVKKELRLVWFGCGEEDFLLQTSRATMEMLKKHGSDVVSGETEGGRTWVNWRAYLHEFTPLLFTEK